MRRFISFLLLALYSSIIPAQVQKTPQEIDKQGKTTIEEHQQKADAFANTDSYFAHRKKDWKAIGYSKLSHGSQEQDCKQAISYFDEAAKAFRKTKEDTLYAYTLCKKAKCLKKLEKQGGSSKEANKLAKQIQKIEKKAAEKDSIIYADYLYSVSIDEKNAGNDTLSLKYAKDAKAIYEKMNCFYDDNYVQLLLHIGDIYIHLQAYKIFFVYRDTVKPLLKGDNLNRLHKQEITVYNRLDSLEKVVKIKKEWDLFINTTNDPSLLISEAQSQAKIGNYQKAVEIYEKVLKLFEDGGDSLKIVRIYNTLSTCYTNLKQYQIADSLNTLSLDLCHRKEFKEEEAKAFRQKAKLLAEKKEYCQANEACKHALWLLRESGLSKSTTYANILCERGKYQYELDSLKNAINLTNEALNLKNKILGQNHAENVVLLYSLAIYYHKLEQMDSVAYFYHNAIELQTDHVRNYFSFQNTDEREHFWQRHNYLYQTASTFISKDIENTPTELLSDIYNAQLFSKGILLNSEIDFRQLLLQSGDKDVLDKYEKFINKRQDLQKYYEEESSTGDNKNRIEQLKQDINDLEHDIVLKCKEFGDFTQNLKLKTDSILHAMQPNEAAIEFFEADISYNEHPDRLYLALILRPEWDAPHACRLFRRSDVEKLRYPVANKPISELLNDTVYQNKIYNDSQLGKLVWGNLLDELDGVEHLFFAPSGIFYQWGIEYMPFTDEGTRICDTLKVYRLSSTKMLAQRRKTPTTFDKGESVIYGGLSYELSPEELCEHKDGEEEIQENFFEKLASQRADRRADSLTIRDMRELRKGFDLLKGASEEAGKIEKILKNKEITCKRYAKYGTEDSFKNIFRTFSSNVSILHVATHGFSDPTSQQYPDPLRNTGLVFAGCNCWLQKKDLPCKIDDNNGILYSQEIALLHMQNLQLVVLSACQTGKGMLQEDGVFGVQRGFKKAGAHTLVMSLWSVDDAATQLMMTSFYEELLNNGRSLHDAFLEAQKKVRDEHPDDPHFWAPFIILDDI